jgi:tyrosinase
MSPQTSLSRYQRVQAILEAAADESTADYGGLGRFWKSYEKLLEGELHGVPIIAPAQVAPNEPGLAGSGRGAASSLVRGLRGQPPFDGSRFPRLPWGGKPVSESDITFISDWIDDGCPRDDHEVASLPVQVEQDRDFRDTVAPQEMEDSGRPLVVSSNEYKYEHGEIKQRMNIDCMTETQIDKLREAMRAMYELNKWPQDRRSYNNIALIHQNHCQHGWERFLPWHRVYLYEFEQALQDHAPDVTMPYWDWTMPQYKPEQPDKGCIIPPAFKAYLTEKTLDGLMAAKPALPVEKRDKLWKDMVEKGTRYTSPSRFFDAVKTSIGEEYTLGEHRNRFIDALLEANALWYPLRYPAEYDKGETINQAIHYHYPTAEDIAELLSLRSFRDFGGGSLYNDAFGFLDQNPHNTMHIWTGGVNTFPSKAIAESIKNLNNDRNKGVKVAGRRFHSRDDMYSQPGYGDMFSNLTASYDPIFWPIHVNVDRLWWEWQQLHSNSQPADLDAVLTPWSYTTGDTLDISRFGYEYVKSSYVVPVGLGAPVGRFVSKRLEIPEAARNFRTAEVRLHRVPQLKRSCFIRVFLNMPDANASVPLDDPHYAGYLSVFGHGPCYGGPGHCALPPDRPRKYDLRPRSHNTPRNHRINVTKTVRKLLEKGARDLQITLVVVGADYREDSELLRLEGLSLNFFD